MREVLTSTPTSDEVNQLWIDRDPGVGVFSEGDHRRCLCVYLGGGLFPPRSIKPGMIWLVAEGGEEHPPQFEMGRAGRFQMVGQFVGQCLGEPGSGPGDTQCDGGGVSAIHRPVAQVPGGLQAHSGSASAMGGKGGEECLGHRVGQGSNVGWDLASDPKWRRGAGRKKQEHHYHHVPHHPDAREAR